MDNNKYLDLRDSKEYELIHKYFPGSFTFILNKKECIPNIFAGDDNTIGVRMPDNEIAINLIKYAGVPIAAPSANISGMPSGTNLENIMKYFERNVDFFIDGGEAKLGISSTIVQVVNGILKILRQGSCL